MSELDNTVGQSGEPEQLLLKSEISEQLILEHPTYKDLEDKLTKAEQQSQEYRDSFLRAKADLENTQRRVEREIANAHKYALEKFGSEILVIVDNLERSLAAKAPDSEKLKGFYNGIELTLKLCLEILQKFGIVQIYPFGDVFDPKQHTAILTKEDPNSKSNTVLEVIQKGYLLKDRLLRPALVIVSK